MIFLLSLRTAYRYGLGSTEKAENPNACLWKIEKMIYKILTYHLQVIQYIVSIFSRRTRTMELSKNALTVLERRYLMKNGEGVVIETV